MYNFIKGVVLIALIIFLGMKISEQYSRSPSPVKAWIDSHKSEISNQIKQDGEGSDKPAEISEQKTEASPEVKANDPQKSQDVSAEVNNNESGSKQSKKNGKAKQFLSEEDKRLTILAKNGALEDLPIDTFGDLYNPERIKKIGEIYEKTVSILDAME